ncbi:MAG: ATP-binding protein [Panacagrimonas sp.]
MPTDTGRPSPEALLKAARKEGRGRLKIFLGMAPGVGKTYAMLRAAQRAREQGTDVCVGLIETHGRAETEAQLAGLELLPRARYEHRGRGLEELDVQAILKRRPKLVLVDEFAHSTVPGAPHPKRYQDVEDLLDAGIDVWTTLNVQHLESLNDIVARITGVQVRETVPDAMLDGADEIELIDLPPEDLIQRLKEGKVYVPEQARLALNQFFGRGALTALRELALRAAAEQIDAQMLEYKQRHAVADSWPTRERMLVCVNETDISQQVIRAARRIADHRRLPWVAVHIETPRALNLSDQDKDRIARNLRLAERLGAETLTLPGNDLVEELVAVARSRNASQIVVGRPQPRRLRWPWQRSIAAELIRRAAPLEITVVTWAGTGKTESPKIDLSAIAHSDWTSYAWAAGVSALATSIAWLVETWLPLTSLGVVFLVAVLGVSVRLGLWPAVFASLLCATLFNFLFTEPRYTLTIQDADDLAVLTALLLTSLVVGNVGGRMRKQLDALKASTRQAREVSDYGHHLAAAAELREVVRATVDHCAATLSSQTVVMRPAVGEQGLIVLAGSNNQRPLEPIDHAAARWALEHDEAAGFSTDTLPGSGWLFLPLTTARGRLGVLGAQLSGVGRQPDPDERRILDAIADLAAVAIERTELVADLERSRVLTESEQLRAALLSSVSHDLRTPLVSVLGAAESLASGSDRLSAGARRELAESILDEAERLNRFVQNLLDMTRLSYGKLEPRLDWCDLGDLIASLRKRLARVLAGRALSISLAPDLPLLRADPVLLEQVLVNLVDNAVKYSPPGSAVRIEASLAGREVLIRVIDHGGGIAEADREQIFDMFFRVRAGDGRSAGTGLGLAICRGLMQAHGGSVRAVAGPRGLGTCIELRLPQQAAQVATSAA